MIFQTQLTVVAVRAEGTIFDRQTGEPSEPVVQKLRELSASSYLVIVSHRVETLAQVKTLMNNLNSADIPYNEIWQSFGIPDAEIWIDNEAQEI